MFVVTFPDHVTELHYAGSVFPSLVCPLQASVDHAATSHWPVIGLAGDCVQ